MDISEKNNSDFENIEIRMKEQLYLAEILTKYGLLRKNALVLTNDLETKKPLKAILKDSRVELPQFPEKSLQSLNNLLSNKINPLEILDNDTDKCKKILKILDSEKFFDFFIILLTSQASSYALETAQLISKLNKPVLSCFIGDNLENARKFMDEKKMIHFENISDLKVLKHL